MEIFAWFSPVYRRNPSIIYSSILPRVRPSCCDPRFLCLVRLGALLLLGGAGRGRGLVPVVQHLRRQHRVQREPGYEPVQDQLVVDLLERCEDPRERACEVVEDLEMTRKKRGLATHETGACASVLGTKNSRQRHSAARCRPAARWPRSGAPCSRRPGRPRPPGGS